MKEDFGIAEKDFLALKKYSLPTKKFKRWIEWEDEAWISGLRDREEEITWTEQKCKEKAFPWDKIGAMEDGSRNPMLVPQSKRETEES